MTGEKQAEREQRKAQRKVRRFHAEAILVANDISDGHDGLDHGTDSAAAKELSRCKYAVALRPEDGDTWIVAAKGAREVAQAYLECFSEDHEVEVVYDLDTGQAVFLPQQFAVTVTVGGETVASQWTYPPIP